MGTWGHGPFENDHARDWCERLRASRDGRSMIESALAPSEPGERMEARALAAAAVVAHLSAGSGMADIQALPLGLAVDTALKVRARAVVEQIRAGSRTRELWDDAGELDEWLEATGHLVNLLD